MPWTPDGMYVDEYGNPAYPSADAYGASPTTIGAGEGAAPPPPYVPPSTMPAASSVLGADPLPVPAVEAPPVPAPFTPTIVPGGSVGSSTSHSQGQSVSYEGTPQAARDQFAQGWEGDKAFREAQVASETEAQAGPAMSAYDAQIGALATPGELAGAPSRLAAETAKFAATADSAARIANMYRDFATQEKAAHDAGQLMIQSASQAYQSQIQQYQSMAVNPGQLWGNMTGGQRAGTFASVFIHDFLGAKGIKTSTMDTINMAIDRNIDAQKANIAKQGQVAGMFKDLYTMAVNESASEDEARSRMRGFYLAQMENDVAAELARYDAPLAQAKMAEAIALLQQEKVKVFNDIRNHVTNRVDGLLAQDGDMRKAQLSASTQRMAISSQERIADADRQSRENMAGMGAGAMQPPEIKNVIRNPFTGKVFGKAENDKAYAEYTEKAGYASQLKKALEDYYDLAEKEGAIYNGPGGKTIRTDASAKVKAAHDYAQWMYVLAMTGKATNTSETEKANVILPVNTWLTNGNRQQVVAQFGANVMSQWDAASNQYVRKLSPQEQAWADTGFYDAPSNTDAEGGAINFGEKANPVAPVVTPADEKLKGAKNERWSPESRVESANTAVDLATQSQDPEQMASVIKQIDEVLVSMPADRRAEGGKVTEFEKIMQARTRMAKEYYLLTNTLPPAFDPSQEPVSQPEQMDNVGDAVVYPVEDNGRTAEVNSFWRGGL